MLAKLIKSIVFVFPLGPLPPLNSALVGLHIPAADLIPSPILLSPKSVALPADGIVTKSMTLFAPARSL